MFQLSIVAYKYGIDDVEGKNPFETRANIVIIVNDVNDQRPLPFKNTYTIEIDEETPMTLNLEDFGFHDIDLVSYSIVFLSSFILHLTPVISDWFLIKSSHVPRNFFLITDLP